MLLLLLLLLLGGTWATTYTRVPHYITSHQRSLLLESLEYTEFDLTREDTVTVHVDASVIEGRIICGEPHPHHTLPQSYLMTWCLVSRLLLLGAHHLLHGSRWPPPTSPQVGGERGGAWVARRVGSCAWDAECGGTGMGQPQ